VFAPTHSPPQEDFSAVAAGVFGSGWAWLIVDKTDGGKLKVSEGSSWSDDDDAGRECE